LSDGFTNGKSTGAASTNATTKQSPATASMNICCTRVGYPVVTASGGCARGGDALDGGLHRDRTPVGNGDVGRTDRERATASAEGGDDRKRVAAPQAATTASRTATFAPQ
jgi:hypothetical protein